MMYVYEVNFLLRKYYVTTKQRKIVTDGNQFRSNLKVLNTLPCYNF